MSDETCPNCGYCKHCGRSEPKVEPIRFVPAPVIIPYQPPAPTPMPPLQPPFIPDWPWSPDGIIYKVTCAPSMPVPTTGFVLEQPLVVNDNSSSSVH